MDAVASRVQTAVTTKRMTGIHAENVIREKNESPNLIRTSASVDAKVIGTIATNPTFSS